jgi:hypothetical protein
MIKNLAAILSAIGLGTTGSVANHRSALKTANHPAAHIGQGNPRDIRHFGKKTNGSGSTGVMTIFSLFPAGAVCFSLRVNSFVPFGGSVNIEMRRGLYGQRIYN